SVAVVTARPSAYAQRSAAAASVPWAWPWKKAKSPITAAPDQREAFTASAMTSPKTTIDDQIAGSTSGTATPETGVAKPASIIATKAIGQTRTARRPADAPQTPTDSIATTRS